MQPTLLLLLIACSPTKHGDDTATIPDGGTPDGGTSDGGTSDGGTSDGGTPDGGTSDGGTTDGGTTDGGTTDGGTAETGPELWLYLSTNLQVTDDLPEVEALLDRAAVAGFTGVVLADFKTHLLHTDVLAHWYGDNLAGVLAHAEELGLEVMPAVLPFGYSEGILYTASDLAEGQLVRATLRVQADGTLAPADSTDRVDNGSFEEADLAGWSWWDKTRVSVDEGEALDGSRALRIDAGGGNARAVQALSVSARQQLHLSFALKTDGFSGSFNAMLYDTTTGHALNYGSWTVARTQDWTRYDMAVNTPEVGEVSLYLGVWGSSSGTMWVDDVSVTESAFVNLVRRDGAPLSLADADGAALVEGVEVDVVDDPLAGISGAYDDWHTAPLVDTSLPPGDSVLASYYAVTPVYGYQVGACLSEPSGHTWMAENLAEVAARYPDATAFFPQYDEMRHLYSCAACQAAAEDPGALLAWHVEQSAAAIEAVRPGARLYYWSDMFDPNHNAVEAYYLVEGDLDGSWEGLPEDAVVMNWYRSSASIDWFRGLGLEQVLAGYYDTGDGAAAAAADLAAAGSVDGIRGAMYTTWVEDYSQLEAWAEVMREGLGM